jgi:putative membrane protein
MLGSEIGSFAYWWIFPLVMVGLCFFMMMRGKGGSMCGFGSHGTRSRPTGSPESARDILDKKYALGEISKEEYEEKKRAITRA